MSSKVYNPLYLHEKFLHLKIAKIEEKILQQKSVFGPKRSFVNVLEIVKLC